MCVFSFCSWSFGIVLWEIESGGKTKQRLFVIIIDRSGGLLQT